MCASSRRLSDDRVYASFAPFSLFSDKLGKRPGLLTPHSIVSGTYKYLKNNVFVSGYFKFTVISTEFKFRGTRATGADLNSIECCPVRSAWCTVEPNRVGIHSTGSGSRSALLFAPKLL
jgi:hypothetical protein